MARGKSVVVKDEVSSRGIAYEKGKRAGLRTREVMDFDPKPRVLYSQKEVVEYLAMYDIRLPSNIEVEWCPPETNVTVLHPIGGVYFHPQIVALGDETLTDSLCP